jgi:hypothetical protein
MAQQSIVGEKVGMTQTWVDDKVVPVTVLRVEPMRIVQIKTNERDGYTALQVTYGHRDAKKLTKPAAGHFEKAGVAPGKHDTPAGGAAIGEEADHAPILVDHLATGRVQLDLQAPGQIHRFEPPQLKAAPLNIDDEGRVGPGSNGGLPGETQACHRPPRGGLQLDARQGRREQTGHRRHHQSRHGHDDEKLDQREAAAPVRAHRPPAGH